MQCINQFKLEIDTEYWFFQTTIIIHRIVTQLRRKSMCFTLTFFLFAAVTNMKLKYTLPFYLFQWKLSLSAAIWGTQHCRSDSSSAGLYYLYTSACLDCHYWSMRKKRKEKVFHWFNFSRFSDKTFLDGKPISQSQSSSGPNK